MAHYARQMSQANTCTCRGGIQAGLPTGTRYLGGARPGPGCKLGPMRYWAGLELPVGPVKISPTSPYPCGPAYPLSMFDISLLLPHARCRHPFPAPCHRHRRRRPCHPTHVVAACPPLSGAFLDGPRALQCRRPSPRPMHTVVVTHLPSSALSSAFLGDPRAMLCRRPSLPYTESSMPSSSIFTPRM